MDVAERHVCNTDKLKKEALDFVVKCSEAANPKSDEEGEDLVKQCELTAKTTLCPVVTVCLKYFGYSSSQSYWKECPETSKPFVKYVDEGSSND